MILQPPMKAKRKSLLKIVSMGGISTKSRRALSHGGDSSTFFFNFDLRLILVFFLLIKLDMRSFSKAPSIDSSLLSCPAYCCKRKLREAQISSSEAYGLTPRRLYGSQTLVRGNVGTLPPYEESTVHLTVLKLLETLRNGNSDVLLEFRTRELKFRTQQQHD